MNGFVVHQQLLNDCEVLGDLGVCRVLLMRDARFPWLILVPRKKDLRDFHDLPHEFRITLFNELEQASNAVERFNGATKVNVAALGNQVPQLHIHVIGRKEVDAAWPGPVWGVGTPQDYSDSQLAEAIAYFKDFLSL